jgi:hypothetical protein
MSSYVVTQSHASELTESRVIGWTSRRYLKMPQLIEDRFPHFDAQRSRLSQGFHTRLIAI